MLSCLIWCYQKKSGKEVCQELRKLADTPIIVITAKDSVFDKVELLDLGANDYICKPFAMEELLARIRVSTRNKENSNNKHFYLENEIKMDILAKKVFLNEEENCSYKDRVFNFRVFYEK